MKTNLTVKNTSEYKVISTEETFRSLETSADGLTNSEVQRRVQIFGFNEVAEKRGNPVIAFLSRYWGPMPWLLELAIVLSIVLKHYLEAGIIFALLTINTVIGQIQSRGSQRALDALKKRLAIKARALRDGNWVTIDAKEIVPGDIISVGLGDIVPADAKLTSGGLSIDQSILTGESLPVDAHQSAVIYSGSIVSRGEAKCVVVNTGANTYFGRTAELVKTARPKSHQEQIMLAIVRYMMFLGIGVLIPVAIYAAITGMGILSILTFAVIFLMAAIPVALPAVMAIVQSVGAMELARKGVLVTRLESIEDAASIDVLCLDKTGTITQNKLSVGDVVPFAAFAKEDVTVMANLASQGQGKDAIDTAVLDYAKASNVNLNSYKQVSFTPFEPSTKRSEAIVSTGGQSFKVIKGAPQTVLSLCKGLDEATKAKANQVVEELSLKGYRTLGIARSPVNDFDNIQLVGLLSLADPPRTDSKAMIEDARALGVKPVMLTGDNIAIAREIARQVSIGDKIIRMEEFRKMDEAEQAKTIEETDGFAEIYPEDKYLIVKLLQSRGHMVGMTGDGVNDAPALKQAEMGIAVSSATDVAKASASTVLTEPGVGVIIDAIKTSRHIYQRMLTWVINKVTKVIQVIGLLAVGFFWFHDMVISLLGMALLIFANDFVTMSLATDNVEYTANPNKWNVRNITFASLIIGALFIGEGAIALFVGSRYFDLTLDQLRTFIMLALIFTSQFRVYIVRERRYFWSSRPGRELLISTAAALVIFALLGVFGLIVTPVTPFQMFFVLGLSVLFTFGIDYPKHLAFKLLTYRILAPAKAGPKPEAKAKAPSDLTPQIAKRAYELYEQRGRQDGGASQDWEKAEREIRKDEAKAGPKPEAKAQPKPEAKAGPKPEAKAQPKPEAKAGPKPEAKAQPKPEAKAQPKPEAKADPKPEAKAQPEPEAKAQPKPEAKADPKPEAKAQPEPDANADPKPEAKTQPEPDAKADPKPEAKAKPRPKSKSKTSSDLTPQIVKRVHELYEELGREDVRAVEDLEKAERETGEDEVKAEPEPEDKK